jgi:hypothetical protein
MEAFKFKYYFSEKAKGHILSRTNIQNDLVEIENNIQGLMRIDAFFLLHPPTVCREPILVPALNICNTNRARITLL